MRGRGKSSSVHSNPGMDSRSAMLSAGGKVLCIYGKVARTDKAMQEDRNIVR